MIQSIISGAFFVPIMMVVIVVAILAMIKIVANNYIKVPPNKVAIFYGRKRVMKDGTTIGFRVISGGAKFKMPIVESVTYLDLNVFPIDLVVKGVPNKDGVLVNARGVANVKILSDEISMLVASERFLGMEPQQIKDIAFKNLEGHLRAIIGRLTVEDIVSDRTKFNQEVLREAGEDLRKIGLGVDVLTIQEIDDEYGYIKALGQKRTAEVMRDATIGKAEADRDATLRATTAQREAQQKSNENLALIAEAEKERDVKKARYLAEVQREQALATQAGPLAQAEARKKVVEQEVDVERIKTLKEAEVAMAEADRREKELIATVIKPAEAEKIAAIARAEGEREATIRRAEAEMKKLELEGQGQASAIRADGQAEADVIRMKLTAEAEGIEKRAEAFKKLDEAGRNLQILEVVRHIVSESLEKLPPVMGEIAKPLGNVDRISLVDFGGNGPNSGSIARFGQTVPLVLAQMFEGLKAVGIDPADLVKLVKNPEIMRRDQTTSPV
jgi:flotillin